MKILKSVDGNFIELTVTLHGQSEKAILISDATEFKQWIPKSQLQAEIEFVGNNEIEIIIPEWLAIEKELI